MLRSGESKSKFFHRMAVTIILTLAMVMTLSSSSYAGGSIEGTSSQDYLNSPAVGPNVVGYLFGEYPAPQTCYLNLFVRRCECLKRLAYTNEGVLFVYPRTLSQEEYDALTPSVLVGMIDPDGQLSEALGGQAGLVAVIERVLEYKKTGDRFMARLSIKFVSSIQ